jgi:hypothetical protein
MKKLETLPVDLLEPGMQVASALVDEGGRVLLPEGVELSEITIASLRRRGIREVCVEREVEEDPVVLEHHRRQVTEKLDRLFRHAGQGSETRALYQVVARYRMEHRL